jgi:hypothetical protein
MSAWSLECDVWLSDPRSGPNPSVRQGFAAGWNRHAELHGEVSKEQLVKCADDIVTLDMADEVINKRGVALAILERNLCGKA